MIKDYSLNTEPGTAPPLPADAATETMQITQEGTLTDILNNVIALRGGGNITLSDLYNQNVNLLFNTDGFVHTYLLISEASTNDNEIIEGVVQVGTLMASNNSLTAIVYIKIFDVVGAPAAGVTTPIMTIMVPPNSTVTVRIDYITSLGLGIAITGGIALLDATAVLADQVALNINYKS